MTRYLTSVLAIGLLWTTHRAPAQQGEFSLTLDAAFATNQELELLSHIGVYRDPTGNISYDEVRIFPDSIFEKMPSDTLDLPLTAVYWFRFSLDSFLDQEQAFYLMSSQIYRGDLYAETAGFLQHSKTGLLVGIQRRTDPRFSNAVPFILKPGNQTRIHYRIDGLLAFARTKVVENFFVRLLTKPAAEEHWLIDRGRYQDRYTADKIFHFTLGFFAVFIFLQFWLHKDKAYLAYSLYALSFLAVYLLKRAIFYPTPFSYFNEINPYLLIPVSLLPVGTYLLFLRHFLQIDSSKKDLFIALKTGSWLLAALAVGGLISIAFFEFSVGLKIYFYLRDILIFLGVYFVWLVFKQGDTLSRYVIAGTFLMLFGGILAVLNERVVDHHINTGNGLKNIQWATMSYAQMGILAEMLVFGVGLGYRWRMVQQEKADADRMLVEAELRALRAQLNPHFIFNSMNAIKLLIQENRNEAANRYLETFSKLLRAILSDSEQTLITLEEELDRCRLYLEMEALRLGATFRYSISIENGIDAELFSLPPLTLQPFIENAIWHGLMKKQGDRVLNITVERENERIICRIDDNGVGRAKTSDPEKTREGRRSFGLKLAADRLRLAAPQWEIKILDRYDERGESAGTTVSIEFRNHENKTH